jgi:hypothetical protein
MPESPDSPSPQGPVRPAARSGPVVPATPSWHGRLAAHLAYRTTCLLATTLRWSWEDHSGVLAPDHHQPVIYAAWHNRILLSLHVFRRVTRGKSGRRLATLVSASRDGGLIAHVLGLFNAVSARGSSSRRGAQALRDLMRLARNGCDIAITPDGPRGPRYKAQEGIIVAAQFTGLSIVPVTYHLPWKISLRSWDAFQIPLPFSRCHVTLGKPLRIPRELSPEQLEGFRAELESRMRAITRD